ncbi:MAG: MFS transporter [Miltoncostaeaceae bacterium]
MSAQIAAAAVYRGLPALVPDLRDELGISLQEAGFVVAAPSAGNALMLMVWGVLADRRGERWLLPAGMAGAGLGLAIAAVATDVKGVIGGLFITGLFSAVAITSVHAASEWSTRQNRAAAVSLVMTGIALGGAVAAFVLPLISGPTDTSTAFAALAALAAASALALAVLLRPPPAHADERPSSDAATAPYYRDVQIWWMIASAALLVVTSVGLVGFIPVYFHEELGVSTVGAGAVLAAALLATALVRIAAGHLGDRLGRRLLPNLWFAAATALLVPLMVVATDVSTGLTAVLAVTVVAVSFAGNGLSATAIAERAGSAHRGAALAMRKTLVFGASVAGPVVLGSLIGPLGWEAALTLMLVPAALSAAVIAPLAFREGRATRPG